MTQTDIPTWLLNFQRELMAALDAAWKSIEASHDPAALRQARDKAKAIGDLAAMARKVGLITPRDRAKAAGPTMADAIAARLHAAQGAADGSATPPASQVEHARRALDKLKGGRRGRL